VRIALSSYRSKPHSGGQGVYVRNLSRELVALGHQVEVFSGQPYPELDPGVALTPVPSLDLYRDDDPFRTPALREFRDVTDLIEFATMCTGGFPEPRTFSRRLARVMQQRAGEFDILHDNQTLGTGILRIARTGLPVVSTVHHPISADRRVELAGVPLRRKLAVMRWYGFVGMQRRVARQLEDLITVSQRAAADIVAQFGVAPDRLRAIPVGVDVDLFRPPVGARVPGRLVTITSADVAMKGLSVLLQAVASAAGTVAELSLVVVGRPSKGTEALIGQLGLSGAVRFVSGLSDAALAELMSSAEIAVVPSLYEGFSLPAIEAMACGTPLVATDVGALPELIGEGSARGVLVRAGDAPELSAALTSLLAAPSRRSRMGRAGRARAVEQYSWTSVAGRTAEYYREILDRGSSGTRRRTAA
jgi:glycosyltransferase involved in cell wall biosynthesis